MDRLTKDELLFINGAIASHVLGKGLRESLIERLGDTEKTETVIQYTILQYYEITHKIATFIEMETLENNNEIIN